MTRDMNDSGPAPSTKYWHDHVLGCDVGRAYVRGHSFPRHSHETFILLVSEQGAIKFARSGRSEDVGPESVITLWPEEPHAGIPSAIAGWSYRALYPSPITLRLLNAEFLGERWELPNLPRVVHDRLLAARLTAAHDTIERGEPMERETAFAGFISELIARGLKIDCSDVPYTVSHAKIARSIDFIHAHYSQSLSIHDLYAIESSTMFQFIRAFQRATGMSVHSYVTRVRLSQACRRLARGEPASQVATAVGFSDQSHLIRRFRQAFGVTPGAYVRDSRV